jgi:hypothetical protein
MILLYKWAHEPGRAAHIWYPERDWLFSVCGRSAKFLNMIDGGRNRCKTCSREIRAEYERLSSENSGG